MKKTALLLGCIISLASCNKKPDIVIKQPKIDTLAKSNQDIYDTTPISTLCYEGEMDKDSIFLSYEDNLGTVTGKLRYKHFQKDDNNGDISGLMSGDTLKLNYSFVSEGMNSDREIWFLKKGTELVEAIGKYDETGTTYQNPKNITFTGMILQPTDCKKIEKQLNEIPKPVEKPKAAVVPVPVPVAVKESKNETKEEKTNPKEVNKENKKEVEKSKAEKNTSTTKSTSKTEKSKTTDKSKTETKQKESVKNNKTTASHKKVTQQTKTTEKKKTK